MGTVISGGSLATNVIQAFEQTFVQLDDIITALGSTKTTLWPFLETVGDKTYPYKEQEGELEPVAAADNTFDPFKHEGGVHSYMFDPDYFMYLKGEDNADYEFGDGSVDAAFSVGLWVYPLDVTSVTLMSKWDLNSGSEAREWKLGIDSSSKIEFSLYDESANASEVGASTTAVTVRQWTHIVVTYDGTETAPVLGIYQNGTADATTTTTETGSYVSMEALATRLLIGAHYGTVAEPTSFFDGRIALPFVCGTALTAANVSSIYDAGKNLLGT